MGKDEKSSLMFFIGIVLAVVAVWLCDHCDYVTLVGCMFFGAFVFIATAFANLFIGDEDTRTIRQQSTSLFLREEELRRRNMEPQRQALRRQEMDRLSFVGALNLDRAMRDIDRQMAEIDHQMAQIGNAMPFDIQFEMFQSESRINRTQKQAKEETIKQEEPTLPSSRLKEID